MKNDLFNLSYPNRLIFQDVQKAQEVVSEGGKKAPEAKGEGLNEEKRVSTTLEKGKKAEEKGEVSLDELGGVAERVDISAEILDSINRGTEKIKGLNLPDNVKTALLTNFENGFKDLMAKANEDQQLALEMDLHTLVANVEKMTNVLSKHVGKRVREGLDYTYTITQEGLENALLEFGKTVEEDKAGLTLIDSGDVANIYRKYNPKGAIRFRKRDPRDGRLPNINRG